MPAKFVRQAESFAKTYSKLDLSIREKLDKLIAKAAQNPQIGKPMKYTRKGTRELYLGPFRLSYYYDEIEEIIAFLDLYHKDEQ